MPILGAHVDSSGGLHLAYERAKAMGAEAIQVHPTPPGFWGSPKLDEARIATFKEAAARHGKPPFYFHAVYLINLAGDDPTLRQRSESTLAGYLKAADELGVDGVIFHTGSHKGGGFEARLPQITEHLRHVLERADPKKAKLLIENNAGLGGCVGAKFEEIRQMLDALDNDQRISVCFDTCHAFASGYDERNRAEVKKTIDELDRVIGLKRIDVIHCNDSVTGLASNRDRHANIGDGQIGEEGFRALLHERWAHQRGATPRCSAQAMSRSRAARRLRHAWSRVILARVRPRPPAHRPPGKQPRPRGGQPHQATPGRPALGPDQAAVLGLPLEVLEPLPHHVFVGVRVHRLDLQ